MAEVFSQIIEFMQNEISFVFNGHTYVFTWWELCVAIMVIEVGIFVVYKIMGD